MLRSLYNSFDRRRRPLRDHHYLIFPAFGVAYARIPGAPYLAVSDLISSLSSGIGTEDRTRTSAGSAWTGGMELMTARELKKRHPDMPVFSVLQSPDERIAAAFQTIIETDSKTLPTYFADNGFHKDMTLSDFVQRVCLLSDVGADNLFRSQSQILTYRGRIVPDFIYDLSELRLSPARLMRDLSDWTNGALTGRQLRLHQPEINPEHVARLQQPDIRAALRARYRFDYTTFFDTAPLSVPAQ